MKPILWMYLFLMINMILLIYFLMNFYMISYNLLNINKPLIMNKTFSWKW